MRNIKPYIIISLKLMLKQYHYYYYYLFIPLSLRTEHRALRVPCHPRILLPFLGSIRHLVGLLGEGIVQRKATTYTGQNSTEIRRQTFTPRAGFETTIPMFERPNTILALDSSAIETVSYHYNIALNISFKICP
jgi:hypothetical protein